MVSGLNYMPGSARQTYMTEHEGMSGRAGLYGRLLRFARHMNAASNTSHVPAMLTAAAYADSPEQQRDVMRFLRAVQAMTAAPGGMEAMRAGTAAIRQSPNRMQALREVGPQASGDLLMQALPLIHTLASELL
jgi:hypothetical protein